MREVNEIRLQGRDFLWEDRETLSCWWKLRVHECVLEWIQADRMVVLW